MRRITIVLLVCLAACSPFAGLEEMADIKARMVEQKTQTKGLVEPLPEMTPDPERPALEANPFTQSPQTVTQDWRDVSIEQKRSGRK